MFRKTIRLPGVVRLNGTEIPLFHALFLTAGACF